MCGSKFRKKTDVENLSGLETLHLFPPFSYASSRRIYITLLPSGALSLSIIVVTHVVVVVVLVLAVLILTVDYCLCLYPSLPIFLFLSLSLHRFSSFVLACAPGTCIYRGGEGTWKSPPPLQKQ